MGERGNVMVVFRLGKVEWEEDEEWKGDLEAVVVVVAAAAAAAIVEAVSV
jgi:hypothetical protein